MTTRPTTGPPAKLLQWAAAVIAAILILVPFHAFLSVWLSGVVGHYTALRLWKEVLLVVLLVKVGWLLKSDASLRRKLLGSRLHKLMFGYVVLCLVWGVAAYALHRVTAKALAFGLVVNLRFIVFFLVVWVVAMQAPKAFTTWPKWLFWPLGLVTLFGLLQYFVLPYDFLRHFGYTPQTIFPYETINHNVQRLRIFSTLRGANPLGAYLVLLLSLLVVQWRQQHKAWQLGLLGGGGLTLVLSFSRSAWLGLILSLAVIGWLSIRSEKAKKGALIILAGGVLIVAGLGLSLRHNTALQDVVLHTDDKSTIKTSSNDGHASALKSGLHDLVHQPLGQGVGSAGPASVYNAPHRTRIAENYFIQIGQETGWLGLLAFLAINWYLALALWRRRRAPLALGLLAALVGLSFVNLLSHAWTDDTLAYLFWGLAAVALASPDRKQVQ